MTINISVNSVFWVVLLGSAWGALVAGLLLILTKLARMEARLQLIERALRTVPPGLRSVPMLLVAVTLVVGCAPKEEPLPPLPPHPEDLSTWSVPALVHPPKADLGLPSATNRPPTKEEQLVDYQPGISTKVQVPLDGPLDIVFQPGEEIRNIVGGEAGPAGDTPPPGSEGNPLATPQAVPPPKFRWEQTEGKHGAGESLQHHLFLHAKAPNLTMGVVVTTNRRVYYLTCKSVKTSRIRVVRWQYPDDGPALAPPTEPGLLPDPVTPRQYHVGYTLTSSHPQMPDWMPRYIVDDGKKMFLVYPEIVLFQTVPVVRMIGPNGPQLINTLQYLNVVIVDQLAPRLELRVGIGERAEVVTIARGQLRTIQCGTPEQADAACPVWPAAAQTLAQRRRP